MSGFKIQDTDGTMTTYLFPENTKITANGYLVLKRTETKITLNNDTDSLSLISPDGKTIDSINYTNAKTNQSYSKTNSGFSWSTTLTPGAKNSVSIILPKPKKPANNIAVASLINSVNLSAPENTSLQNQKTQNPWLLFLIAIAITIISAIITLIIKLKLFSTKGGFASGEKKY